MAKGKKKRRRCTAVVIKCSCGKRGTGKATVYRGKCGGRRRGR